MFFPCISLCMFKNWQKIWPVRGFGSSLSVFFWQFLGTALLWGNTSNRKQVGFQKQRLSHFLPLGLSIQSSRVLDHPSILAVVVTPSSFRLFSSRLEPRIIEILSPMYTSQTQSWKMCTIQVALDSSWLEISIFHAGSFPLRQLPRLTLTPETACCYYKFVEGGKRNAF